MKKEELNQAANSKNYSEKMDTLKDQPQKIKWNEDHRIKNMNMNFKPEPTINQAAKEFCEAEGIHIPELQNGIMPYLTKFTQSLIDKGVIVEPEKWISVKDGLPEIYNEKLGYSNHVLAYSDSFSWGKWFISRYDHQDETWAYESGHDQLHNPITHWIPIPNAPGEHNTAASDKTLQECKDGLQNEHDITCERLNSYIDSLEKQLKVYEKMVDRFIDSQPVNSTLTPVKVVTDEEIQEAITLYTEKLPNYHDAMELACAQVGFKNGIEWHKQQLSK